MSSNGRMAWRSLLAFELGTSLKGALVWAALAGLVFLILCVRGITTSEFSVNGQPIGQDYRLMYLLGVGYSAIVFLSTLLALSLCQDRAGTQYLRNNDLLVLTRPLGRPVFYLVRMASVLIPSLAYAMVALTLFWEEVYRIAGVNLYRIFLLILPLSLGLACQVGLYFLMRIFLGNFIIFFFWLLLLPVIYVGNLWRYYAGVLREGAPQLPVLGLLPQFGGLHAHSLGMMHDAFRREGTWLAVINCGLWAVAGVAAGIWLFRRQRL